jgi:threonine dehydrogenase-like Zn-dependent dehydrogenase
MKAAVVEKPEVIAIKQVPVPEIGDTDVLIKVKYTGICGTDWSIYTGKYSADKLPLIAGMSSPASSPRSGSTPGD